VEGACKQQHCDRGYVSHARRCGDFHSKPNFIGQKPVLNPHDKYNRKAEEVAKWQPKTKPMKPPTILPANALRNKNTKKPSKGPSRRKIGNRFMPRPTLSANLILITHRALGQAQ
jgi:hypothetical protein